MSLRRGPWRERRMQRLIIWLPGKCTQTSVVRWKCSHLSCPLPCADLAWALDTKSLEAEFSPFSPLNSTLFPTSHHCTIRGFLLQFNFSPLHTGVLICITPAVGQENSTKDTTSHSDEETTDPCECVCVYTHVCDVSVFRDHSTPQLHSFHSSIHLLIHLCVWKPNSCQAGFWDTTLNKTGMDSVLTDLIFLWENRKWTHTEINQEGYFLHWQTKAYQVGVEKRALDWIRNGGGA